MKTKELIYIIISGLLLATLIIFKKIDRDSISIITYIADLFFLLSFSINKLTNTKKKIKIYKSSFILFSILSLINEGIIKNEGMGNLNGLGFDLLIKVILFILIFSYLKNAAKK